MTAALLASPAIAQPMACRASIAVPDSSPPANVDVLSRTNGSLILQRLGGDALADDVLGIVVILGPQNVAILIMREGFACRFPLVPLNLYERARRQAMGVEG